MLSEGTKAFITASVILIVLGGAVVYFNPFADKPIQGGRPAPPLIATKTPEDLTPPAEPPHKPTFFITDAKTAAPDGSALAPAPGIDQAANAALDQAKKQVQIKLYSTPTSIRCANARVYLQRKGYRYSDFDVSQSDTDMVELRALNPSATVPTFSLDGVPLIDPDPEAFEGAMAQAAQRHLRVASH